MCERAAAPSASQNREALRHGPSVIRGVLPTATSPVPPRGCAPLQRAEGLGATSWEPPAAAAVGDGSRAWRAGRLRGFLPRGGRPPLSAVATSASGARPHSSPHARLVPSQDPRAGAAAGRGQRGSGRNPVPDSPATESSAPRTAAGPPDPGPARPADDTQASGTGLGQPASAPGPASHRCRYGVSECVAPRSAG